MKWYHWGLIAFSAIAGGWIGVWWTKGGVPDSGDPGSRTIAEPVKAAPIGDPTREKPEWRNLLEAFPTLSQLAAQAMMLEHLETVDFLRLLERAGAGRIKDQATAALLAERIAELDEELRLAGFRQLLRSGNCVILEVYAVLFPSQAASDLAKLPAVSAIRPPGSGGRRGQQIRDAFAGFAAMQPEEALELALGMKGAGRVEAVAAVACAFLEAGREAEALDVIGSIPPNQLRSLPPHQTSDLLARLDSLSPRSILDHSGSLPRGAMSSALKSLAAEDPADALSWLQQKGGLNSRSAVSFARGLRSIDNSDAATRAESLVSEVTGPGSAALRRETMGSLAYAAAQHFPEEVPERIHDLPEGFSKDQTILDCAMALARQDDAAILSVFDSGREVDSRLVDALSNRLMGQPRRLIQLSESLPQDVQERIVSQLKERWGEEIDPYLK